MSFKEDFKNGNLSRGQFWVCVLVGAIVGTPILIFLNRLYEISGLAMLVKTIGHPIIAKIEGARDRAAAHYIARASSFPDPWDSAFLLLGFLLLLAVVFSPLLIVKWFDRREKGRSRQK